MASVKVRFGDLHDLKVNKRGVREVRCYSALQSLLIDKCLSMAEILNATFDGVYDVGPNYFVTGSSDYEPVYGRRHTPPEGAHAFVRTADRTAAEEQAEMNVLNWVL